MKNIVVCCLLLVACGPRSVPGIWIDTGTDEVATEPTPVNGEVVMSQPEPVTLRTPEVTVIPSLLPDEPLPSEEPSSQPSSEPVDEPTSQPTTPDDENDDDDCSSDNWCRDHKVLVCHKPQRHHSQEICIDRHAIKAHKKHGDHRGLCK
jgi:hypothetical protein